MLIATSPIAERVQHVELARQEVRPLAGERDELQRRDVSQLRAAPARRGKAAARTDRRIGATAHALRVP